MSASTDEPAPFTKLVGQVIAVEQLDEAIADFQRFGLALSNRSARPDWCIDTATFGFDDGCYLELVSPLGDEHPVGSAVSGFLARRGPGLYMSTLQVPDVDIAYERLIAGGVDVAGPPVPAPSESGIDCRLLWPKPRATAGAFLQLVSYRGERHVEDVTTPGIRGLFNEAIAVSDIDRAVDDFVRLGLDLADRSSRSDWGLDTATFHLSEHGSIELVAGRDDSRPASRAISEFVSQHGGGHYMIVIEVDDVDDLHDRLVAAGVAVLGPPKPSPPESPWPPARQLWIHPRASHGAFVEFLTPED